MKHLLLLVAALLCGHAVGLAEISVSLTSASLSPAVKGGQSQSTITVKTSGDGYLLCMDYSVTCGGVTTQESMDLFSLSSTADGVYTLPISYNVPNAAGSYPTTVTITSVNYSAVSGTQVQTSGHTSVVERRVPRYTLVEEYTGTGCGNCPRGWLGMQRVKEEASDIAGVVAIHQYNTSDPMYCADYLTPHYTGAPACWLDRTLYPDPLEGANEEGILTTLRRHVEQTLPTVALTIEAHYNADASAVSINSSTEFLTSGAGYTIAYILTADGLTGSGTKWMQTNYYNENSAWMMNLLYPGLGMEVFAQGGKYGQDPVSLVYDDVLIGSTWRATALGIRSTVNFSGTCAVGTTQQNSGTVSLPTLTTLRNAIDPHRVYATVVVIDAQGRIANAARCLVEEPTGIDFTTRRLDETTRRLGETTRRLDITGRRLVSTPHHAGPTISIEGGHKRIN